MTGRGEVRSVAADWVRYLAAGALLAAACDARAREKLAAEVMETESGTLVPRWEIGGVDAPRGVFTGMLARERIDGSVLVADPTAQELHFYQCRRTVSPLAHGSLGRPRRSAGPIRHRTCR